MCLLYNYFGIIWAICLEFVICAIIISMLFLDTLIIISFGMFLILDIVYINEFLYPKVEDEFSQNIMYQLKIAIKIF